MGTSSGRARSDISGGSDTDVILQLWVGSRDSGWLCVARPLVTRLELAAIDARLVGIGPGIAVGPTQNKSRAQGKDDGFSIQFRLNADSFRRRRKSEVQSVAKNHGIRIANDVGRHGVDD